MVASVTNYFHCNKSDWHLRMVALSDEGYF